MTDATDLLALVAMLRESRGFAHKRDIDDVMAILGQSSSVGTQTVPVGDDCAAIPDSDGYLLLAIEGFLNDFVSAEPWFAGYCGVMVNVSDIYAMGGRPIAVVNAFWSRGGDAAKPLLEGLAKASKTYGVPIVGGHSNRRNDREQLSVAILGRAKHLLTSFDAKPGESLVAAIDLRGSFHEPYAYWDASSNQPAERLCTDLALLPMIAESGWSKACKDISMAGIIGTALMLLECSGIGADIDIDAIPRPPGVALERWLTAFPSYGFLLSVPDANVASVLTCFQQRDISAAVIGITNASHNVTIRRHEVTELLWNFEEERLIGCGGQTRSVEDSHHA